MNQKSPTVREKLSLRDTNTKRLLLAAFCTLPLYHFLLLFLSVKFHQILLHYFAPLTSSQTYLLVTWSMIDLRLGRRNVPVSQQSSLHMCTQQKRLLKWYLVSKFMFTLSLLYQGLCGVMLLISTSLHETAQKSTERRTVNKMLLVKVDIKVVQLTISQMHFQYLLFNTISQ